MGRATRPWGREVEKVIWLAAHKIAGSDFGQRYALGPKGRGPGWAEQRGRMPTLRQ